MKKTILCILSLLFAWNSTVFGAVATYKNLLAIRFEKGKSPSQGANLEEVILQSTKKSKSILLMLKPIFPEPTLMAKINNMIARLPTLQRLLSLTRI